MAMPLGSTDLACSRAPPPCGGAQEAAAEEEEREVVRFRVKKCESFLPPDFRSFAVDPQITSLDVLQHILIRAFDLNGKKNFGISYLGRDRLGQETYFSLLSDWDLSTAFATASKPYLQLRVDIWPSEDSEYAGPQEPCSGTYTFPMTPPIAVHSLRVDWGARYPRSKSWLGHWVSISFT
ncbi:TBC1 domain family member 25-like [Choloepus didactylus]|uniref:TBC1 domain family member 25-like n=1 Tax=Choloepus didactylus TaxID=27675 RepID=UPI00189E8F1A|nr:TBC1 domain family member 25-like [Choloepus didactylus]